MTKTTLDLEQATKRIRAQLEEVRDELDYLEQRLQNKPEFGLGSGSPGVYSWEMALNRKERATQTEGELRQALERVEAGTYGICQQCGQPINPERLEILPEAALCVTCAAARKENGPQPQFEPV